MCTIGPIKGTAYDSLLYDIGLLREQPIIWPMTHLGKRLFYDIGTLREQLIIWHQPIKGRAYYMT